MRRIPSRLAILAAAAAIAAACSGDVQSRIGGPCGIGFPCSGSSSGANSVVFTLAPTQLAAGDTATVVAYAVDSTGAQLQSVPITFTTTDSTVVIVSALGTNSALAQGVNVGSAEIVATGGGASGRAPITVQAAQLPMGP